MKLSKKYVLKMLAVAGVFGVLTTPAFANDHEGKQGKGGFDPAQKADKMKKELNLSDEQTAKIRTLLEDKKKQKEEEFKKNIERFKAERQEFHDQIAAVLTEEQRQKFETLSKEREEKIKTKMKEKMKDRGGWKERRKHDKAE